MKTNKRPLIGLVCSLAPLVYGEIDCNEIKVVIATLNEDKDSPRNFSYEYNDSRDTTGGCYCRIFARRNDNGALFDWYGPDISYGGVTEYAHALAATKKIAKHMDKIHHLRGSTDDAAELIGRFLEAAGVKEVWIDQNKHSQWLTEGNWQRDSIGSFVNRVRTFIPQPKIEEAVVA